MRGMGKQRTAWSVGLVALAGALAILAWAPVPATWAQPAPEGGPVTRPAPGEARPAQAGGTAGNGTRDNGAQPSGTQAGASTRPATNGATKPTSRPIIMKFENASIDSVLDYLSDVGGFIIIKQVPRLEGRVTVTSRQPVSPTEAVALLNTVLKQNGYTAIQSGPGGRQLKIVAWDRAKKLNIPVKFGADPAEIEDTDELVTQVVPVRFVDAVKLKQDLTPLIGPDADVSSNAGSNSLIITDSSANIKHVVEIVAKLDQHQATAAEIKVFHLEYANSTAAAKLIMDIFKTEDQDQSGRSRGSSSGFSSLISSRFFGGGGPPGFGGPGGSDRSRGGRGEESDTNRTAKVNASADERTNTVVVAAPPDTLKTIESVIKEIDSDPTAESSFFIYPLRNATATNLESVINNLFGGGRGGSGYRGSSSSSSSRGGRSSSSSFGGSSSRGGSSGFGSSGFGGSSSRGGSSGFGSSGFGSSGRSSSGYGGSSYGSSGRSSFGGGFGGSSYGGLSSGSTSAASALAGQVYVVADPDTNSLLVMTATKFFQQVRQILQELDRPVPQVLIKVLIAEVTHDNSTDLGVEFSILNQRRDAAGNIVGGQSIGTDFGLAASPGGLVAKVIEANVTATLRALQTEGKLDVLSRPYILASDNQQADIIVGQQVPFVTNTRTTESGQIINTIQYENVGIILYVTPHINPEGLVIMDVSPEISQLTGTTVPISEGLNAPVIATRSADSRIGIRDGQTVVIGGLMEDRKTNTVSKVPLLGDIPLLGALFTRDQLTKSKTELLIFLTPHVASDPDVLKGMSQDEMKGTRLTPNAVAPGVFDDAMRNMERGAATQPSEAQRERARMRRGAGTQPSAMQPLRFRGSDQGGMDEGGPEPFMTPDDVDAMTEEGYVPYPVPVPYPEPMPMPGPMIEGGDGGYGNPGDVEVQRGSVRPGNRRR